MSDASTDEHVQAAQCRNNGIRNPAHPNLDHRASSSAKDDSAKADGTDPPMVAIRDVL